MIHCVAANHIGSFSLTPLTSGARRYPHGVLDDVEGISDLCKRRGVLLHVDSCLGGFVLPFLKHVSPEIGGTKGDAVKDLAFDFNLDGVTSMSLDVHKFGCSHKGTSVVRAVSSSFSFRAPAYSFALIDHACCSDHSAPADVLTRKRSQPFRYSIDRQRSGDTNIPPSQIGQEVSTYLPALPDPETALSLPRRGLQWCTMEWRGTSRTLCT